MKRISTYWRELLCLASGSILVYTLMLWITHPPQKPSRRAVLSLFIASAAIIFVLSLRSLWRRKWRDRLAKLGASVLSRVSRFLARMFERFGNTRGGKTIVSGKTTLIFHGIERDIPTRKLPGKKKWKQLASTRERLGHLYQTFVTLRIRGGTAVYASDTPTDVQKRTEELNTVDEERLLSLYIRSRYDDRIEPLECDVVDLRERLDYK